MKKNNFYKMQIGGLSDVTETVRVIEKSAAAHIHFLKKKVHALSEYKQKIQTTLERLSRFYWDDNHPLLQKRDYGQRVLLVVTGEKGIVGGLYHELINKVITENKDYGLVWVIGNKGKKYLSEEGDIQAEHIFNSFNFDDLPQSEDIQKMANRLFERFQETNLKNIDVLYTNFISLAEQNPTVAKFLPFNFIRDKSFDFDHATVKAEDTLPNNLADGFPIFEHSKQLIFDELLKKYINVSFAEIILEAKLSEFSARTVTAESAVKQTQHLIKTFNRELFKSKHLTITQKQIESFSVHQLTQI